MKSSPSSSSTSSDDSSYFMIGLILGLSVTVYLQYRRGDDQLSSSSSSSSSHASSLNLSPSTEENPHDVFISFRGEDTRRGFVSHLHDALRRNNIITYRDNSDLERGNRISSTLLRAIEQSKISIIVFSKNYASSSWTKNELVKIMDCQETRGQVVLPIFYEISPSKVRKKTSYSTIFMFWSSMNETQQRWAKTMEEAAGLAGWDSSNFSTDSELVDVIVSEVKRQLEPLSHSSVGLPSWNGSPNELNSGGSLHDDPMPEDSEPLSHSSEGLPSRNGSPNELNSGGSLHDDPMPEDSEPLSHSSEGLPSRNGSPDEPDSGGSSHDDPIPEDSEPLSHSSEGLPSLNGSPDEPNSGGSLHDDPMPEDSEPLSQSSEGLPSRNGSPDEPDSGGSSHDDPMPEDSEPLSHSSEGLPSLNGSPDEPNSGGSLHDDPTPEDSEPLSQSSEGLPSRNGSPDEPDSGGSSHDDHTPKDLEPLSQSSEGLPSRNGSPDSGGSSHDDHTPKDLEPLSQSSEGLPSRNGQPNEPNSGGSSHDDLTPEDSSSMNCLSHRILNLLAYLGVRRTRHRRLPDQPLNLNTSWSCSLHRLAINENVNTGTVFYPNKSKGGTGGRTTVTIDMYELKQIHFETLRCIHSNYLQWPST